MTTAEPDDANRARELGQRLLLEWRVRCGLRQAAVAATSNAEAMALCVAVARTLEQGGGASELALAACTWTAGIASSTEGRAALLCLCDVAAEAGTTAVEGMAPQALDIVLEQLAIVAAPAPAPAALTPTRRHQIDPLTGCRGRRAFEADLDDHVALAALSGTDVTVVLAELAPRRAKGPRRSPPPAGGPDDVSVLGLVAALRRAAGSPRPLYRVGESRFALLLPGTSRVRAGELMLLAACGPAPAFDWGVGSLAAAGARARFDRAVIVMLADADLHTRRRDLSHATAVLARRRRASVVTGAAATLALLGGSAFALDAGAPGPALQAALRAHAGTDHAPAGPAHTVPAAPLPSSPPAGVPTATPPATTTTPSPSPESVGGARVEPASVVAAPPTAQAVPAVHTVVPTVPTVPTVPAAPTPTPTITVPVPTTTTPPGDTATTGLVTLVTDLLHEAKHAVGWGKERHAARS